MKLLFACAFAIALLVAVFVVSAGLGPSLQGIEERVDPTPETRVERELAWGSAPGESEAASAELGGGPRVAARVESPVGRASAGEGDPGTAAWVLQMRVRLIDGPDPSGLGGLESLSVTLDGGGRRNVTYAGEQTDAEGQRWLYARCDIDAQDLELATFTLATSGLALAAGDGRVLVGDGRHWRGSQRLDGAAAIDRPRRSIDLGVLELLPPKRIGRLVFDPQPSVDTSVLVGAGIAPDAMAAFFPGRRLGQTVVVPRGTTTIACASFGAPESWFARMTNSSGQATFSGDARAGQDITIRVAQRSGLDVTVDLRRYPRAARVLFLRSNVEMAAITTDEEFFGRVSASESSTVLPLPERSVGRMSYPVGLVELADGFYRAELWSLKQADGSRSLLASQAAQVAGDVVTVSL